MEDRFASRRARLRELMQQLNASSIAEFAQRYGYTRSQISQYLSDTYNGGRSLGERAARTLEERTGFPQGWLDQPSVNDSKTALPTGFPSIPVVGAISADRGVLGTVVTTAVEAAGLVSFPTTDAQAYALQVRGGELRPRFRSGEVLILEPNVKVAPGDDVLAKFSDGSLALLEFLWERDGEVTFGDITSNFPPTTISEGDIVSMHRLTGVVTRSQ